MNAADQERIIGITVLTFISLVTVIFYFLVKNAWSVIRVSTFFFVVNLIRQKNNASIVTNILTILFSHDIKIFAEEVKQKVLELDRKKMKTEKAFHCFLPKVIARNMRHTKVRASCFIYK